MAVVESQFGSHVYENEIVLSEQQAPIQIPGGPIIGMNKVVIQEMVRSEWVLYN